MELIRAGLTAGLVASFYLFLVAILDTMTKEKKENDSYSKYADTIVLSLCFLPQRIDTKLMKGNEF